MSGSACHRSAPSFEPPQQQYSTPPEQSGALPQEQQTWRHLELSKALQPGSEAAASPGGPSIFKREHGGTSARAAPSMPPHVHGKQMSPTLGRGGGTGGAGGAGVSAEAAMAAAEARCSTPRGAGPSSGGGGSGGGGSGSSYSGGGADAMALIKSGLPMASRGGGGFAPSPERHALPSRAAPTLPEIQVHPRPARRPWSPLLPSIAVQPTYSPVSSSTTRSHLPLCAAQSPDFGTIAAMPYYPPKMQ